MEMTRSSLPNQVKVVGWLSVFIGSTGSIGGVTILLAYPDRATVPDVTGTSTMLIVHAILGVPLLVCSIGLLNGCTWGRIGVLSCYVGMFLDALVWSVQDWVIYLTTAVPDGAPMRLWPHPVPMMHVLTLAAMNAYVFPNLLNRQAREAFARRADWRASLPNRPPF